MHAIYYYIKYKYYKLKKTIKCFRVYYTCGKLMKWPLENGLKSVQYNYIITTIEKNKLLF